MMKRTTLVVTRLTPNKKDRAQVMAIGDLHLGAKTFKEDLLKETIKFCLDNKIYVIGMGCKYCVTLSSDF